MNGVVERWIGSTETIARSILYEARLPHQLWDYAIEHAVWIKNRVPTAALPFDQIKQKTPFEAYYNKIPSLKNLKVFGCKADVLYPPELHPQTWVSRIREGKFIMIGMQSSKIWKLLDTVTLQEAVSADAKFNEYSFGRIDISKFSQISTEDLLKSITGRPKGVKQKSKVYNSLHAIESDNRSPSVRNADNEGHNPRDELSRVRNADDEGRNPRDELSRVRNADNEGHNPRDELSGVRNADNRMDHSRDGSINIIDVSSEGRRSDTNHEGQSTRG
ncbi:hypothetical protein K3495_g16300, partial [Podosphaera aphanis]